MKAHNGQPFGNANCIQCHDPHQSAKPKLMQAFVHNPFENKMCDSCHAAERRQGRPDASRLARYA